MTNEEMQRTMEFILQQQGQFATDIQRLTEVQATFQKQLGKLVDANLTIVGMIGKVVEAQAKAEERLSKGEDRISVLEAKMIELAESQKHTDERLNALIDIVERYISGNGREKP